MLPFAAPVANTATDPCVCGDTKDVIAWMGDRPQFTMRCQSNVFPSHTCAAPPPPGAAQPRQIYKQTNKRTKY